MEKDDKWKLYRPKYTISLAVILIIVAAAGIIATYWVDVYITSKYYNQPGIINLINLMSDPSFNPIYTHLAFVASLIGSVICAIAVIGLYYMKKWAYHLGVTILIIYLICFRMIIWFL